MTQQDYNTSQESLARPEISAVSVEAIKRLRLVSHSARDVERATRIMKETKASHIHKVASEWGEKPWEVRAHRWAKESNYLSPVVESFQMPIEAPRVTAAEYVDDENIELTKDPSFVENAMFLDRLNADKKPLDMFDVSPEGNYLSPEAQRIQDAQKLVEGAFAIPEEFTNLTNENFTIA